MLTLVLGGARSGKSGLALTLARSGPAPVTFIATAQALDDEMTQRISAHQDERPASWATTEEPIELGRALADVGSAGTVIVDCLTLWVANLMGSGRDDTDVLAAADQASALAAARSGPVIIVSNEVGWGIVPVDAGTRRYRDLLGRVNATFAARSARSWLMVAGQAVPLQAPPRDLQGTW